MAKVLLVDDDSYVRTVMIQALKEAGHQVFSATNGIEAMRHFPGIQADLIITDLFMPEQEGLETITKLRRQFPDVAILAISGGSSASSTMLFVALQLGATHTLEKPFDKNALLAAVELTLKINPPRAESGADASIGPILPESH